MAAGMELFRLFGRVLVDTSDADESLDGVDQKAKKSQVTLGDLAKAAGAATLAFGAMAVGLGVKAVHSADEFNKAMNGLKNETAATSEEMDGLQDAAKEIYNGGMGESFEDIAKTMANVKQVLGGTADEIERSSKNALLMRDTFDMDVAGSVGTVNSLMKKFGITADQAYTLIAQGAQQGANKNGDLLDVLNEYSPQFSALGFSAEQFTDILIQGSKDGAFQVDKVGDAIKEFTIRSKDMSATSTDAFTSLGLDAAKMSQAFAAGGESAQTAFQQVMAGLSSLTDPVERNRIGVELFGTQFEDLEAQGILALGNVQSYTNQTAETLADINNVKYDNFGAQIEGIGRMFETGILIPLGERLLPKLQEFAEWFKDHMPEIEDGINKSLDVVIGLFEGFAKAIQWVIDNGETLTPIIVGLTGAIAAQAVINTINNLYKAWSTATKSQTTLQWLLNAALNANPLGLVALAIGVLIAAGVLLYKNWDTVKAKAGELWAKLKEVFGNVKSFLVGVWEDAWGGIKGVLNKIIGGINRMIGGLNKIQINIPDWVPEIGGKNFGIHLDTIATLATGTDYFEGGTALVGEEGAELVSLPRGTKVTNHGDTLDELKASPEYVQTHIYLDGQQIAEVVSAAQYSGARNRGRMTGVVPG